jgi:hypothetical protein
MTIFFFLRLVRVLEWGLLFDERRGSDYSLLFYWDAWSGHSLTHSAPPLKSKYLQSNIKSPTG